MWLPQRLLGNEMWIFVHMCQHEIQKGLCLLCSHWNALVSMIAPGSIAWQGLDRKDSCGLLAGQRPRVLWPHQKLDKPQKEEEEERRMLKWKYIQEDVSIFCLYYVYLHTYIYSYIYLYKYLRISKYTYIQVCTYIHKLNEISLTQKGGWTNISRFSEWPPRGNGLGQDAWGNSDAVDLEFRCLNILKYEPRMEF